MNDFTKGIFLIFTVMGALAAAFCLTVLHVLYVAITRGGVWDILSVSIFAGIILACWVAPKDDGPKLEHTP